jgi:hypothetical protein
MLRTLENILGYRLIAAEGEIGKVHDFFLDDALWRLRYLVVETGNWMQRRRVLIAKPALGSIDGENREFMVQLTREQVQNSPDVDTEKPVSRQQEMLMNDHYGWPAYWAPEALMVLDPIPLGPTIDDFKEEDPHLRSFRELRSYRLNYGGEPIAKMRDLVIDDGDWSVTQVVASYGGLLDSRLFAVPASSIVKVSWSEGTLTAATSEKDPGKLPIFDPSAPVNRIEKIVYVDYYGRLVGESDPAPLGTSLAC